MKRTIIGTFGAQSKSELKQLLGQRVNFLKPVKQLVPSTSWWWTTLDTLFQPELESIQNTLVSWILGQVGIVTPEEVPFHTLIERGSSWIQIMPKESSSEEFFLDPDLTNTFIRTLTFHQTRADITTQIETFMRWFVSKGIKIPEPTKLRDYLSRYPDIESLILPICIRVYEKFPTNTQLSVEVYVDPEIEDSYITIYVRQEPYDEKILDIIGEINGEFEEELSQSSGWLIITTDYRKPL